MKWRRLAALLVLTALFLTGCNAKTSPTVSDSGQVKFQGYDAYVYHGESSADAKYIRFRRANGVEEFTLELPKDLRRLVVEYQATVKSGQILFKVKNPDGKAIIGGMTDKDGKLKLYHSLRVPPGTYTVHIDYKKAEEGDIRYTMYGYYK